MPEYKQKQIGTYFMAQCMFNSLKNIFQLTVLIYV